MCKFAQTLIFSANIAELSQNCFILSTKTFCFDLCAKNLSPGCVYIFRIVYKEMLSRLYVHCRLCKEIDFLCRENYFILCARKSRLNRRVFCANKCFFFRLCARKCRLNRRVFCANKCISDCVQGKPEVRSDLARHEARSTKYASSRGGFASFSPSPIKSLSSNYDHDLSI